MKTFTLIAFIFSLFATTHTLAQTKENQNKLFKSNYNQSKVLVQSRDFSFVGDMVYENKTRERLNADSNTISIKTAKVSGILTALTSKNETFNFNGAIEDYKVLYDDEKQQILIQFNVKTATQTLNVRIEVKPNTNAFLEVKSKSSSASYVGKLKSL
jgi:hypothetical protein